MSKLSNFIDTFDDQYPTGTVLYNLPVVGDLYYRGADKVLQGTQWGRVNERNIQTSLLGYLPPSISALATSNTVNAQYSAVQQQVLSSVSLSQQVTNYTSDFLGNRQLAIVQYGLTRTSDASSILLSRSNGFSWGTTLSTSSNNRYGAIAYGNGVYIVVNNLRRLTASKATAFDRQFYTSTNGLSWSLRATFSNTGSTSWRSSGTATFGNGVFVASAGDGTIYRSDNLGASWTNTGGSGSTVYQSSAYGNGIFILGRVGQVATSTNGSSWTSRFHSGTVIALAYGNGIFMSAEGPRARTSTNGVTWTLVGTPHTPGTNNISSLQYDSINNRFYSLSTSRMFSYSDDNGNTWTPMLGGDGFVGESGVGISFGKLLWVADQSVLNSGAQKVSYIGAPTTPTGIAVRVTRGDATVIDPIPFSAFPGVNIDNPINNRSIPSITYIKGN